MDEELKQLREFKKNHDTGNLVPMVLDYQNNIEQPPITPQQMYSQAASGDQVTMNFWEKIWIANVTANKTRFGSFKDHSIGKFFNLYKHKPCIIAGAGPSLKKNGAQLKNRDGIGLISCLHNFHFFEDHGVDVDFYVSLDGGAVTVEEVYEGGNHPPEHYWERTKKHKLLAFIGTHPDLLAKWQGEIYFFNSPTPSQTYRDAIDKIEIFNCYVSTGGNVLGACLYIAKGYMCANTAVFTGADFCFSYLHSFHAWDSKYDAALGNVVKMTDVYGNKVLSWQSYANFKAWFDQVALSVPGIWINCTEGGTFGAFPEGNLYAIKQMKLSAFLDMNTLSRHIQDQALSPETAQTLVLF